MVTDAGGPSRSADEHLDPARCVLRPCSCILAGEAVACGDDGIALFERIRYRRYDASVFMWAFDIIELNRDVRDLLVYCVSGRCHHSATLKGDWLSDEMPVRSLASRIVYTRCGMIGADVRPDWGPHVNKRRV
jgi:hypothetical protein